MISFDQLRDGSYTHPRSGKGYEDVLLGVEGDVVKVLRSELCEGGWSRWFDVGLDTRVLSDAAKHVS
jgi:hypothetical protein